MSAIDTVSLASLGDIITGSTPPSKHPEWFADNGTPFVTPSDIVNAHRSVKTTRFLSSEGTRAMSKRIVPEGAVCFVSIGSTIGKMCSISVPSVTNQQINTLVVDPAMGDPTFVYYALARKAAHLKSIAGGSATPILNKTAFSSVEIAVLPVEDQRLVGRLLDALDDKIESNLRAIGLMQELLDVFAVKVANNDWRTLPLGEVGEVSHQTVNPATLEVLVDHFSIPAFDAGMRPERVQAGEIKSNKLRITQPSILISRLNPRFNRTWWCVPQDEVPALASTEFLALSTDNTPDLAALWLAVRDPYFMSEVPKRVTGTSGSHQRIRPDDLLSIKVPDTRGLPMEDKEWTAGLLRLVHQRRCEIARLEAQRDALLPELLSGRIRVPEAAKTLA